jgi:hypothetical protein
VPDVETVEGEKKRGRKEDKKKSVLGKPFSCSFSLFGLFLPSQLGMLPINGKTISGKDEKNVSKEPKKKTVSYRKLGNYYPPAGPGPSSKRVEW